MLLEALVQRPQLMMQSWRKAAARLLLLFRLMPSRRLTLTFLPWSPLTDLTTLLMMSHFSRSKRLRHPPSS